VVKVAAKVELDIALCMDSRGRLREGGKECSLLGAGRMHSRGARATRSFAQDGGCEHSLFPATKRSLYGVLTYSRSLGA